MGSPEDMEEDNGLQLLHILHIPHCELIYTGFHTKISRSFDLPGGVGLLKVNPKAWIYFHRWLVLLFWKCIYEQDICWRIFLICQTFLAYFLWRSF